MPLATIEREGEIPREEVDQFLIVTESRIFLKIYRLDARRLGSAPRQPLFLSTSRPLLLEIARRLLAAMGRTRAEQTPPSFASPGCGHGCSPQ